MVKSEFLYLLKKYDIVTHSYHDLNYYRKRYKDILNQNTIQIINLKKTLKI